LFSAIHERGRECAQHFSSVIFASNRKRDSSNPGRLSECEKSRVIRGEGKWKYRAPRDPTQAAETGEASVGNASRDEDIRRRAYEIYSNAANNQAVSWTIGSKPKANSNVGCFGTRRRAGKRIREQA